LEVRGQELLTILPADVDDAAAIAAIHAASWRSAYRGFLPDAFLDGPVLDDRLRMWTARMRAPAPDRRCVLKATVDGALAGFACVLLDAEPEWGALLDNLHVRPDMKGQGVGSLLFAGAREWVSAIAPGESMHLTVIEGNLPARRFYERQGGRVVERTTVHHAGDIYLPVLRYVWPSLRQLQEPDAQPD
jgi:GNAT superfamily N-acetyltransferase